MADLNPRQKMFIQLYTTGPEGIRGNGTAAYKSAGYQPRNARAAEAAASRLLSNVIVQKVLQRFYRERDAQIINQLEDWRLHAPRAQRRILALAIGLLPQGDVNGSVTTRRIENNFDLRLAQLMADQNQFIIERAYPHRIYATLSVSDPLDEIGRLLGVLKEDMPTFDELMVTDKHLNIVD